MGQRIAKQVLSDRCPFTLLADNLYTLAACAVGWDDEVAKYTADYAWNPNVKIETTRLTSRVSPAPIHTTHTAAAAAALTPLPYTHLRTCHRSTCCHHYQSVIAASPSVLLGRLLL